MKRLPFVLVSLAAGTAAPALAQQAERQPPAEEQPAGRIEQGVFVPEGSALAEVLEQQAANKAQAATAKQHAAANEARAAAYAEARAAYEAELVRLDEERKAKAAEAARVAAAHEAAMAKWRADVAACEDGDRSRCAPD